MTRPALIASLVCLWPVSGARADYMDHFVIREDIGLHKAPSIGPAEILVIPVQVNGTTDAPLDLAAVRQFFSDAEPNGFVNYYKTASLGRYQPHVTVGPLITYPQCPLPAANFPNCRVNRGDVAAFGAGMDMMRDIVSREHQAGMDFSQFDVNGRRGKADGFIDGLMILTNIQFGGIAFPIGYFNKADNLDGGAGGPLYADNVKISHIAISGAGNPFVLIHEFGHVLGLTDLYDESFHYDGLEFSQMGSWLYSANIPLPDAESRYRLRWGNVIQVSGNQSVTLRPAETSGDIARLGTGDEYFLFENRGPGGSFDRDFTTRGLVGYHVDRTVKLQGGEGQFVNRLLDGVEDNPWHPYIHNLQADGRFDLEVGGHPEYDLDLFRDGQSLGPDSSGIALGPTHLVASTNLASGQSSGTAMRVVRVNADRSIDAVFTAPVTDPCGEVFCSDGGPGCEAANCSHTVAPHGCSAVGGGSLAALALALLALSRRVTSSGTGPQRR